jgi:hypothetical protein
VANNSNLKTSKALRAEAVELEEEAVLKLQETPQGCVLGLIDLRPDALTRDVVINTHQATKAQMASD